MGSRENLDLVRSIYAAWQRGDFSSADWASPGIEFVMADGVTPGRSTGTAAMTAGWREWLMSWNDFRTEPEEFRQLDEERVLVLTRFTGRAKTSGIDLDEVTTTGASLFHVRDGKVTRLVLYTDRDRALADLGLSA